jgi:porin
LQHDGIYPTVTFVSDLAGNPSGGKRQGFTEADQLGVDFYCDLGRLFGLPGAKAEVSFGSRSGSSLTDLYINNLFEVQQAFGGETFRFIDLLYEQSLANDRWNVRIGRLVAGDEFLFSPLYTLFMQNGINGNPVGIEFDAPGFTTYPVTSWGARFRYRPVEQVYVMTGFYDGNPNVALNQMNGFDFTLRGPLFWITEAGYALNDRKGATGLPATTRSASGTTAAGLASSPPCPRLPPTRSSWRSALHAGCNST